MAQPAEHAYRGFLTAESIIAEARTVADTDGLDAVSMRVLATRLRCTPRALYRHVTGKEEVLELLADTALADLPVVRRDLCWPDALLTFFTAMRALLVASPAVARIVAQQAVAGPHFRRHADHLVSLLLDAGFDADLAAEATIAMAQYTLGASLPGTGQRLHDTYRDRRAEIRDRDRPALAHVTRHLTTDDAHVHFTSALRRLIQGYRDAVPPN